MGCMVGPPGPPNNITYLINKRYTKKSYTQQEATSSSTVYDFTMTCHVIAKISHVT